MKPGKPLSGDLGAACPITRRDFVNGALAGSGAALLAGCGPSGNSAETPFVPSGSSWTGYGGVGDYASSNGNTEAVMDAAHGIRDLRYPDPSARPVDEEVDLVVVGGGFSGMTAAYEFGKRAAAGSTCLLLDNHPVFGGEAKQNEFEVDGRRLTAPQGSNGSIVPRENYVRGSFGDGYYDVFTDYYREFGLPTQFELEPLAGGAERYNLTDYHFAPMSPGSEESFSTGYHFPGHGWAENPSQAAFANTPWPGEIQKQIGDFVQNRRQLSPNVGNTEAWLDTITYADLLDMLGYGAEVCGYIDPYIAVGNFGVGSNAISAYAAHRMRLPGTALGNKADDTAKPADIGLVSFPGGNTVFMRTMLQRMLPDSIGGDGSVASIASGPIAFASLDRAGAPLRIRLGATAIDVRHEGDPASAEHAIVTYVRDGTLRRARAKAVIMGSGGWVNRNIVADLGNSHRAAYAEFRHAPVMIANVALRHWRFIDKMGFTNMRSFGGLGWQTSVRRNVALGDERPFTPDDPTVLTFYIPFLQSELPAAAQGPAARMQLFSTSYVDFEKQLREQLTDMFGGAGFDARRDIAGIILNRWGHAYCSPQPGFYFGRDNQPPPPDVIRRPHGRVTFAHSELLGAMSMAHSMHEAHRAVGQVMSMI
jgi:spermidine dehydrogenase